MIPISRPLVAAALMAAGAFADHAVSTTSPISGTSASVSAASVGTASLNGAGIDTALEHAFAVASPSVVFVNNVGVGSGSGVIYDSNGDIVTNEHVVAQAQSITVTLNSGKTYTAKLVGSDTADDLAVIHINATGLPAAQFSTVGSYAVAETVLAIGSPLDLQQTVTSGLISALNRTVQEPNGAYLPNALQTSAPINPGNSGGALVNLNGVVVGIPTLEASDPQNNNGGAAQGIGFAIPGDRVTYIAHQIITTGSVQHTGRAYLGVSAVDSSQVSSGLGQGGFGQGGLGQGGFGQGGLGQGGFGQGGLGQGGFGQGGLGQGTSPLQVPTVSGAVVESVAANSPASKAGVQVGDVITAANGAPVTGEADLLTALAKVKPGASMSLTINRNGTTLTIHATLGELSASQ